MADVASKQQTTALFLSTIVTRTRRHTDLTKKTDKPDGKPVPCQRTFSSVFRAVFFYTVKRHSLTYGVWGPLGCMGPFRFKEIYQFYGYIKYNKEGLNYNYIRQAAQCESYLIYSTFRPLYLLLP